MTFSERLTTQKGDYAESIIDGKLLDRGWVIYKPVNQNTAHSFDRLCIKDKKVCMIAEVKAKSKRKYYPDTGINYKHYQDYKLMMENHGLDTFLFFVDEEVGKIYGNYLSKLEKPDCYSFNGQEISYPKIEKNSYGKKIIYFHIELMVKIADLNEEEVAILSERTTKKECYKSK